MTDHFCETHNTRFFDNKDGTFTHKIPGVTPAQYCIEKTAPANPPTTPPAKTSTPQTVTPPKTHDPKNRSVAISYSKDMVINGFEKPENLETLADRFLRYIEG